MRMTSKTPTQIAQEFIDQIRSWHPIKPGYTVLSCDSPKSRYIGFKLVRGNVLMDHAKLYLGILVHRPSAFFISVDGSSSFDLWKTSQGRHCLANKIQNGLLWAPPIPNVFIITEDNDYSYCTREHKKFCDSIRYSNS